MSVVYKCNVCGETIERDTPLVVLSGDGERSSGHWRTGWVGHFHADPEVGCWQRILEVIRAADGWAPRLETIPTAPDEAITEARRKHRREDPGAADDHPESAGGERTADGES